MADFTIYDYSQALTIDGSTHWLLIQPGDNSVDYKRINRATFLGVSGQPADISSSQSLTNKTLDNTNIVTFRDDRFTLQDSGDATRQAQFQLSSITAGQTRVYTLPDVTDTLVSLTATQTMTNKTLTSPTINGGTVSNVTLQVNAISEFTAANGVTIDGLNIKDSAITTSNSVPNNAWNNTGAFGSSWATQNWTPSYTAITVGNGTVVAKFTQIGKMVYFRYSLTLGSSSSIGTNPTITFPVTTVSYPGSSTRSSIGQGNAFDTSGGTNYPVNVRWNSTTAMGLRVFDASTASLSIASLTATVPMTWATGDELYVEGWVEAA